MNVLNSFKLDGQVIIVTGGEGLLGKEYSRAIAEAGGTAISADIKGKPPVDITDKEAVAAFVKKTLKKYGRIDGLVNNAALNPKLENLKTNKQTNSFEEYSLASWNRSLAVDVTGMFLITQAVAPIMLKQKKGSIVNISSIYGLVGPDQSIYLKKTTKPVTYSVTKSGVIGFTKYLATYWVGKGIRVNTLTPGGVFNNHDEEFVTRYSSQTTLRRMAKKDEYNAAVIFLLSDASSYMSGSNLVIDGGWTAW